MPAKPKPVKTKKRKPKSKGICPQCGFIFRGTTAEHYPFCEKEIAPVIFRKNKTDKQMIEAACDLLCRLLVEWRDGVTCVLANVDGVACSRVPNWGHVIPQGGSAYLVYELSNSFRQCSAHNIIHDKVNPEIYLEWYSQSWGRLARKMLKESQIDHSGQGLNEVDLMIRLTQLNELYALRYSFGSATIEEKVQAGFYGEIIREAWIKEGRF